MGKRNRKVPKKSSVVATGTSHMGVVLIAIFFAVIINILASSSCKQILKSIGENERKLARLEDACTREESRWEEMKTPEKIEAALMRHGLAMRPPRPDQIVRMTSTGKPYPGQLSLLRAKKRETQMASYDSSSGSSRRRKNIR